MSHLANYYVRIYPPSSENEWDYYSLQFPQPPTWKRLFTLLIDPKFALYVARELALVGEVDPKRHKDGVSVHVDVDHEEGSITFEYFGAYTRSLICRVGLADSAVMKDRIIKYCPHRFQSGIETIEMPQSSEESDDSDEEKS